MIALAAALVVVGIVLLFVIPWVGIPIGALGLVLAVLYAIGIGRRTTAEHQF